jgi:sulfoxide reductase heme-binding subunit YedZ
MQTITAYIIAGITALCFLLIAALIALGIDYEGGARPKDPARRRAWFWILAILNPAVVFLSGYFLFKPDANVMILNRYTHALSIGTGIGFVGYILLGFILSKVFKKGKIGHWF